MASLQNIFASTSHTGVLRGEKTLRGFGAVLFIFTLSFLVYANSIQNEFIWDDIQIVKENTLLTSFSKVFTIFKSNYWDTGVTSRASGNYRPVTILSFLLNNQLGGVSPQWFRVVNIAIHSINSVLVLLLALGIGLLWRHAFLAGVTFALHPVHTEPVVWIVGRGELLACFFLLTALLLALKNLKSKTRLSLPVSLFLFFAGLLSKESAATLPLLVFILALLLRDTRGWGGIKRASIAAAPYLLVLILYLFLRYTILGRVEDPDTTFFTGYSAFERFLTMVKVVAFYWFLLLFPVDLRAHYDMVDFPLPSTFFELPLLASGAFHLSVVFLIGLFYYRRMFILFFSALWVYVTLLPYMQIIRFQWVFGERFLYIPSVGFSIMLSVLFFRFLSTPAGGRTPEKRVAYTLVFLLFGFFFARTMVRNLDWRNEIVFYRKILDRAPTLAVAYGNLGYAYLNRGNLDEAENAYKRSLELRPGLIEERRALNYILSLKKMRKGNQADL